MKVYSDIDKLKMHTAGGKLIDGCMALEGGAFRGIYTSGVLDCLMENGINMSTTVGVSAGALNGVNYSSRQICRSALLILGFRHDSRWVGTSAVKSDHGIIGFDFLQKDFLNVCPFDLDSFHEEGRRFIAVATNIDTGKPEYFDSTSLPMQDVYKTVAASASMPFVTRPVTFRGRRYLDGGCSTKLPIRWALKQDFRKVIFVGTNRAEMRRNENSSLGTMARIFYRNLPEFAKSLSRANAVYNSDCDMMDKAVSEGKMFRISPSVPVEVSRLEGNMEKLGELYHLGLQDARNALPSLREYLEL